MNLKLTTTGRPKQDPPSRRFFAPKKSLALTAALIAREMTISRIARMLEITIEQAEEEHSHFVRFVESRPEMQSKWKHEMEAWIDYRIDSSKRLKHKDAA